MELLTLNEVAEQCRVCRRTVNKWVSQRILSVIRAGNVVRVRPNDLAKALEKLTEKAQ